MKNRILELEKTARLLDPTPEQRAVVRNEIVEYTESFLNNLDSARTFNSVDNPGAGLLESPISEEPLDIESILTLFRDHVDKPALNPASGGHLGYIPGGGIYYSALGDYLADVTNRYAGIFFAGPGAVRMENMLIRWLAELVGYPPRTSAGNLTTGGSLANLISIVTARDAMQMRAKDSERAVIYLSQQVHHSVDKAIRIAGLRDAIRRYIPMDDGFRMIPSKLEEQIQSDERANLIPFLIIASAGTTDTGAIDPLQDIADIASAHGIWYHVDAAYGGFFVLVEETKNKLQGMDQSDSLIIDPHKGLFLPYGLGVALVKKRELLYASHYYVANYMQDALPFEEEPSPAELSPELTKHFRGLRLWLPLKLHGLKPFRACLQEKLLLAQYFYREVRKLGFETGPEPELSVVTYRYIPPVGDADEFNKRLLEEIVRDGRVFISSTRLNDKFTLRFACLTFRTHLRNVDLLLQILKEKVAELIG